MEIESLTSGPNLDDFTLLTAHQEQTPGTFFGGKPVLHLHCPDAQLRTSTSDVVASDSPEAVRWIQNNAIETPARDEQGEEYKSRNVDTWVTSRNLILYSPAEQFGVKLEYSTITFHAQEGSAVLLGLNTSDSNTADEDIVFFHVRLVPGKVETYEQEGQERVPPETNGHADPARLLFDAISACQELNPDPPQDGDEDEDAAFDETAPGATGWITSENIQGFMDENGQFRMPPGVTMLGDENTPADRLGEGAGTRRTATERDADDEEDESKWQRTG